MGATIHIGREIQCLPYAGFFSCMADREALLDWSANGQPVNLTSSQPTCDPVNLHNPSICQYPGLNSC